MARVSSTASLGLKLGLGHKKGYTQYDSASPHHSVTIEREVDETLTNDELVEKADEINDLARKLVEKKMNKDAKEIQATD